MSDRERYEEEKRQAGRPDPRMTRYKYRGDANIGEFVQDVAREAVRQELERLDRSPVLQRAILDILGRLGVPDTDAVRRIVDERLRSKPAIDVTITTVTRDYSGVTEE